MKKQIVALGMLLYCMQSIGCSNNNDYEKIKEKQNENEFTMQSLVSKGEGGYYCTERGDTFIYYLDQNSMEPIVLCGKAECSHDSKECNGVVEGLTPESLQYIDEKIYYIANSSGKMTLNKMDSDGKNHEMILELYDTPSGAYIDPASIIHKGYLYYILTEIDASTDTDFSKIYRVKIENGVKPELILDGEGCYFGDLVAKDEYLYIKKDMDNKEGDYSVKGELIQMSTDSLEMKTLFSYDGENYCTGFTIAEQSLLCCIREKGIISVDLKDLSIKEYNEKKEENEDGLTISYDGKYVYEDNQLECLQDSLENNNESAYANRTVFVRDLNGMLVDKISLDGADDSIFYGDSSYLFFKTDRKIGIYDKSQIGTGKSELKYISMSKDGKASGSK